MKQEDRRTRWLCSEEGVWTKDLGICGSLASAAPSSAAHPLSVTCGE